jgi:hypothetical protein
MPDKDTSRHFVFPKWSNLLLPAIVLAAVGTPPLLGILVPLALSPTTVNVGYRPVQPIEYSHELHVNQLGMDCRYCHTTVDKAGFAAIPPTQTCMNCHHAILKDSEKVLPIREAWQTGMPIEWKKVHDLPDYSYFHHGTHINAGVSCVECHGRVDQMDEKGVYTVENLSMGWCIECHREPEKRIRPKDKVYDLGWTVDQATAEDLEEIKRLHERLDADYTRTDCSTCHR